MYSLSVLVGSILKQERYVGEIFNVFGENEMLLHKMRRRDTTVKTCENLVSLCGKSRYVMIDTPFS